MLVRFFDIIWDTDGKKIDLKTEHTINVPEDELEDLDEDGADFLSDRFGWCVESFRWEPITV